MSEKPICLLCGKPLRKKTYSLEVRAGAPAPTQIHGRQVVEVVRRKKLSYKPGFEAVSVWCGEWGGYADNFFCGLNCGYRWGTMAVKLNEKQDPGYVVRFRENMKKFAEARR